MARRLLPVAQSCAAAWSFTVAQYNILGGYLAKPKFFPYCPPRLLDWEGRRQRLMAEIVHHEPDIICLEELTDYWTYFRTRLRAHADPYDSAYVQRPSLHLSYRSGRRKQDGCGIFWKERLFNVERVESFNLPDRHDRVALAVLLRHLPSNRSVLIANTHIYWDASKIDEQLEEIKFLDHELARLLLDLPQRDVPVVLCGDFNNTPSSRVYDYMTRCFLGAKRPPGSLETLSACCGEPGHEWGGLPILQSAFAKYGAAAGTEHTEAPHTTVTDRRISTIDYIFYSSASLAVKGLLEVPDEATLRGEPGTQGAGGIPNQEYGSDHLLLMANLDVLDTKA